jgi:threonyl-tRNA synthetase
VFCREPQIKEEFLKIWDIVQKFYGTFGFNFRIRLSFHDPKESENYLGDTAKWERAENILREIAKEKGVETFEELGEAAFYGPKIDFMGKDMQGREWQIATIQLDMNMPDRFDLTCINEKGEKERIVMIHAAIMGSIERFLSVIIEHLGGTFPTWLSPVQARVIPIADTHKAFAEDALLQLKEAGIRAEIDDSNETLGKKIREAKTQKIPYLLVVGDAEVAAKTATLEGRAGKVGALSIEEIISKLKEEIKNRA